MPMSRIENCFFALLWECLTIIFTRYPASRSGIVIKYQRRPYIAKPLHRVYIVSAIPRTASGSRLSEPPQSPLRLPLHIRRGRDSHTPLLVESPMARSNNPCLPPGSYKPEPE